MSINGPTNNENTIVPVYQQSAQFQALSKQQQDSLIESESTYELNVFFAVGTPILPNPAFLTTSSKAFFDATSSATNVFGQTLDAQVTADQEQQQLTSQAAAAEAAILGQEIAALEAQINLIQQQSGTVATNLQNDVNNAESATGIQQSNIVTINGGNSTDTSKSNSLNNAYNTFINTITNPPIGATLQSDGSYQIPQGEENAYNHAATSYQNSVDSYNSYLSSRLSDIGTYNSNTNTYNNVTVATNNANINNIVSSNPGLQAYLNTNGINLTEPTAGKIDTSTYLQASDPPQITTGGPSGTNVTLPTPPSISTTTVTSISYDPTLPTQAQLKSLISSTPNAELVTLENELAASLAFYAYLQAISNLPVATTKSDPLLNTQPISQKILPSTVVNAATPSVTPAATGASAFVSQSVGLGSSHIQGILSRANLSQLINQFLDNISFPDTQTIEPQTPTTLSTSSPTISPKGTQRPLAPAQIETLVSQLQLFLVGQISATSSVSLLPSLAPLANLLPSLPANSPAFGILFSLAFASNTVQAANNGTLLSALQTFIQATPALQGLTSDQVSQLASALNLGQLQLAVSLLGTNLGLPGLTAQALLPLVSPAQASTILNIATTNTQTVTANLLTTLQNHFTAEGFSPEEAQFLAQVGVEVSAQGLAPTPPFLKTQPTATSVTLNSTNTQTIIDNLANSLLSSGNVSDLATAQEEATTIADQLISQNNSSGSASSTPLTLNQLQTDLIAALVNGGLSPSDATVAVQNAITQVIANGAPATTEATSSTVTSDTVSAQVLKDSIAASLLASGQTVTDAVTAQEEASAIVNSLISQNNLSSSSISADQLQTDLTAALNLQGLSSTEAAQVAQESVTLALASTAPVNDTESLTVSTDLTTAATASDTLNTQLLTDSLTASLLLSDQNTTDLATAEETATDVVNAVLSQNNLTSTTISSDQLRSDLESALRLQGVSSSDAVQAAQEAVIAPLVVNSIAQTSLETTQLSAEDLGTQIAEQLAAAQTAISNQVSADEIAQQIAANALPSAGATILSHPISQESQQEFVHELETQVSNLILPQLGPQLTKQVIEAVNLTLYGSAHPDASDIANVKSPLSIINAIRAQIVTVANQNNANYADALTVSFSNSIQNSTDLNTFLLRVMDPAFLYVNSANTGIMYGKPANQMGLSQSYRQSIDINV